MRHHAAGRILGDLPLPVRCPCTSKRKTVEALSDGNWRSWLGLLDEALAAVEHAEATALGSAELVAELAKRDARIGELEAELARLTSRLVAVEG